MNLDPLTGSSVQSSAGEFPCHVNSAMPDSVDPVRPDLVIPGSGIRDPNPFGGCFVYGF